ncbi:hypothetical protein BB559_002149 [Furculomyces boomerangus]|uniref:RRM domain-containing protein n=1 Tax=Furculomyces boomerangus TaxID=61424 RepID=A0A2T9YXM1_9FUNG|nr:hypothetical protein BB559_002149 [Furculomyces boomerangus]
MADQDDFDLYGDDSFLDLPKKTQNPQTFSESDLFQEFSSQKKEPAALKTSTSLSQLKDDSIPPIPSNSSNPSVNTQLTANNPDLTKTSTPKNNSEAPQSPNQNLPLSILLSNLGWWVTEDDLRDTCKQVAVEEQITLISFQDHKPNGKSKGLL